MREIALDTETTGLDPYSGNRIVEIGCVEMENHIRTGNVFHAYLNPERDMPIEAEKVHGLSIDFLSDKPKFSAVAASFLEFIGNASLVIHNARFDMKFINAELEWLDLAPLPMERAIDTVVMARKKYPGQPASLDALCRRFNIDLSVREKHGALLDAELLAEVYLELMGGRQTAMRLAAEAEAAAENDAGEGGELAFVGYANMPERHFPPSSEEQAAHASMLEKINDAMWKKLA
jgi:DNA polymerase-3 subunit epsilon